MYEYRSVKKIIFLTYDTALDHPFVMDVTLDSKENTLNMSQNKTRPRTSVHHILYVLERSTITLRVHKIQDFLTITSRR